MENNSLKGFVVVIDLDPVSKPRMTHRDRWNKRPATDKYWKYKDDLKAICRLKGYKQGERLTVGFFIKMPKSWSKKKKEQHDLQPHQQKPDIDNLVKAFLDCLCEDDSHVHDLHAFKAWSYEGRMVVRNYKKDKINGEEKNTNEEKEDV